MAWLACFGGATDDTSGLTPEQKAAEKARSKAIDNDLVNAKKEHSSTHRLLLLGGGESGKSTIVKQMKIINMDGYSDAERVEKRLSIKKNVRDSIEAILKAMPELEIAIEGREGSDLAKLEEDAGTILRLSKEIYDAEQENGPDVPIDESLFTPEFFSKTKLLWQDPGVQNCFSRQHEYQLIDCAKFFLDKIDEISDPNYLPSNQDILRCRTWTCGIAEMKFSVKKVKFHMFDVGGQRDQRRKWIQCFNEVTAYMFIVASNSYNTMLREDETQNRLDESVELFDQIWSNKFLRTVSCILFLNKQDMLEEKIMADVEGQRLEDTYPEFYDICAAEANSGKRGISGRKSVPNYQITLAESDGDESRRNTKMSLASRPSMGQHQKPVYNFPPLELDIERKYELSKEFIRDKFMDLTRDINKSIKGAPGEKHYCYPHYTCAVDTADRKSVV